MKKHTLRLEGEISAEVTTKKDIKVGDYVTGKDSELKEVSGKVVEILEEDCLD